MTASSLADVLRRENEGLRKRLQEARDRELNLDTRLRSLTIENQRLRLQHDQDVKDLRILSESNARIATREKMVEGALNTAHRRLTPHGFRIEDDDEVTPHMPTSRQ